MPRSRLYQASVGLPRSSIENQDDKECAEAIRNNDANDIELKKCQREYHEKFMKILPASKVFRIIRSEDKFHRRVFRKAFNRRGK